MTSQEINRNHHNGCEFTQTIPRDGGTYQLREVLIIGQLSRDDTRGFCTNKFYFCTNIFYLNKVHGLS